jgi:hypothetical protein
VLHATGVGFDASGEIRLDERRVSVE